MMLPSDLLDRRPEEGARIVVAFHLRGLRAAARSFSRHPAKHGALHDVRVAVRRLRVSLETYAWLLPARAVSRSRRALARMMASTSRPRNCEVAIASLDAKGHDGHAAPIAWLRARWAKKHRRGLRAALAELALRMPALRRALRRPLLAFRARVDRAPAPANFGDTARQVTGAAAHDLADAMSLAQKEGDEPSFHRARLAAKRLRYLCEPLVSATASPRVLIEQLAALQDTIGTQRDERLFVRRLRKAITRAPRGVKGGVRSLVVDAERSQLARGRSRTSP